MPTVEDKLLPESGASFFLPADMMVQVAIPTLHEDNPHYTIYRAPTNKFSIENNNVKKCIELPKIKWRKFVWLTKVLLTIFREEEKSSFFQCTKKNLNIK